MKKSSSISSHDFRDTKYILTRPTRLSDLSFDEMDDTDLGWRSKAQQLQARRWRKIRHQLV
jgi:hypothetical protein